MATSRVSVCMITYNHASYINKALQGIFSQRVNFPLELVIADDCSTDGTAELIQEEISKNHAAIQVRFIRNERNIGVNRNFVNALYACSGDYIAICEGDDWWTDTSKIQKQFDFLENNPRFVMSFHAARAVSAEGTDRGVIPSQSTRRNLDFGALLSGRHTIPTLTTFFRNTIGGKLPKEFFEITNCDTFLFLFVARGGDVYFHTDISGAVHSIHRGGIWSMKDAYERSKMSYLTYAKIYAYFKDRRGIATLAVFVNSVIIFAFKKGDYSVAFRFYLKNIYLSLIDRHARSVFFRKHVSYFK